MLIGSLLRISKKNRKQHRFYVSNQSLNIFPLSFLLFRSNISQASASSKYLISCSSPLRSLQHHCSFDFQSHFDEHRRLTQTNDAHSPLIRTCSWTPHSFTFVTQRVENRHSEIMFRRFHPMKIILFLSTMKSVLCLKLKGLNFSFPSLKSSHTLKKF